MERKALYAPVVIGAVWIYSIAEGLASGSLTETPGDARYLLEAGCYRLKWALSTPRRVIHILPE